MIVIMMIESPLHTFFYFILFHFIAMVRLY